MNKKDEKSNYGFLSKVSEIEKETEKECVRKNKKLQTNIFVVERYYKKITKYISEYPIPSETKK